MSHRAKKRFGQNFLNSQQVIDDIIAVISPNQDQHLVEIGPGQGALSEQLVETAGQLDLIELDRDLIGLLERRFASDQVTIHSADALTFNFASLATEKSEKLRVVGNLPYNISTPLIFHLLSQHDLIEDMHFMLQKEVVDRLCATPGSKQFGRLSIMAGYQCECSHLFDVPPECFDPQPKVMSAIVRLTPRPFQLQAESKDILEKVVAQAFSQRRKTVRNSLKTLIDEAQLTELEINPSARAETIPLIDWVRLANHISQ